MNVLAKRSWTRGSIDKNKGLVEHLQQYGVIKSKKVAEVMETIDRGLFVPNGTAAYVDSPMPIGYNATISAPHMHATCLELLKEHLQPGMHALDVGSGALLAHSHCSFHLSPSLLMKIQAWDVETDVEHGFMWFRELDQFALEPDELDQNQWKANMLRSFFADASFDMVGSFLCFPSRLLASSGILAGTGYLTACFAVMVGPQGHAVGVEHIPEIVASSIENIKKSAAADLWERGSLSVHLTDGRLGWPELAPYDAIHVGAAAPDLPQPLIQQLKPGGRMVIPVGKIFQELKVVDKKLDGSISVYTETAVRYVPLTSRTAQLQGD
ncbi:hypothetical protein Taro_026147 [Colocasia esculenta]|uniref:Protein-L-isoaspartate O-methyltransferase n=1 Tax=Colocasia esculenta TaxID=4460 RepID=A0A843VQF5_COLES|nr:hypothetical protein [Colocasia esculenta]